MSPQDRTAKRTDIYLEPDLREWLVKHSRHEGHHTVSAYVRWLLIRERRAAEKREGREGR